jgi:hypothetical protein
MIATCKTTPYYRRCWIPICISYGGMASQWPLLTAVVGGVQEVRSTSVQWQEPQNSMSMPAVKLWIHVWSLRSAEWLLTTIRNNTTSLLVLNKSSNIMKSALSRSKFDMDMSYARRVRTASHSSHTSYSVSRKVLHQRTASHSLHTSHSVSHKWRHAAAAMRAHNVLCNSYNSITVGINHCSFRRVRFVLLYIVTRSKIV